jgi:hypothetical protein
VVAQDDVEPSETAREVDERTGRLAGLRIDEGHSHVGDRHEDLGAVTTGVMTRARRRGDGLGDLDRAEAPGEDQRRRLQVRAAVLD